MLLLLFLVFISTEIHGLNSTLNIAQNKTKRTSNQHIYTYGESKPVLLYVDNVPAQTNTDVSNFNQNPRAVPYGNGQVRGFFDPPKVAAQQVLYEFQQTPTNAVSNVHVKQLFHTPEESTDFEPQNPQPETNPNQYTTSETVVNPVQHSAYTNHGQNYAHVNYHPLYNIQPHHVQSQHYVPGKYFYVNGRIVYQPNQAYQQNQQRLPLKYATNAQPQQRLMPPPMQPPASYSKFVPPQRHEMQSITNPVTPTPPPTSSQNAEENEEDENASLQENDDDGEENEESERYQNADEEAEEDGERNPVFGRYRFDEDEELDENERLREDDEAEEDDEDTRGGSSKYVTKKTRKSPKKNKGKYNNKDNYSYSEGYSTSSKYEYPKKKKNGKKSQKTQKTRYSKGTRPQIEGRYSENIPITSKHKIFKEKWYVTKKSDDNLERSSEEF